MAARFLLQSGKHHRGNGAEGTRQTIIPGQVFEVASEKEAEFCRKYPDRYTELKSEEYPVIKALITPATKKEPEVIEIDMDRLAGMSVQQLQNFCTQNGINIKDAKTKDDLIKAIRNAAE